MPTVDEAITPESVSALPDDMQAAVILLLEDTADIGTVIVTLCPEKVT